MATAVEDAAFRYFNSERILEEPWRRRDIRDQWEQTEEGRKWAAWWVRTRHKPIGAPTDLPQPPDRPGQGE